MSVDCLKISDKLIKSSFHEGGWLYSPFAIEVAGGELGVGLEYNQEIYFTFDDYCLGKIKDYAEIIKWGFDDAAFSFNVEKGVLPNLVYLSSDVYSLDKWASLFDKCCFDLAYKIQRNVDALNSKDELLLFFICLYRLYRREKEGLGYANISLLTRERDYYWILVLTFLSVLFSGEIEKDLRAIMLDFLENNAGSENLESNYSGWSKEYFDYDTGVYCELDMWFELFNKLEFCNSTDLDLMTEFLLS